MKPHLHTTRRPARPGIACQGSAQRHPLSGYLAGAVGTAALLGAPQAEAAVTAVSFGFGTEYTAADGGGNWTVGPGFGTLAAVATSSFLRLGSPGSNSLGSVYNNSAYGPTLGLASFFGNGTVIGAGANGGLGYGFFQHVSGVLIDFTSDQLNKNIGFQTSTNNWGWANVSWTESTKTLAINEAWVESVANTAITINVAAVPEPSRALLALAGLGAVALRRRRKLVA